MKIGILTYFGDLNPGTNLQAFSLFQNLSKLYKDKNVKIEIINYQSFKRVNRPFLTSQSFKSLFKDFIRINKYLKFQKNEFNYSKPRLVTNKYELGKEYLTKQKYDIIYVGSDTLLELHHADSSGITVFWLPKELDAIKIMIAASARDTEYDKLSENQKNYLKCSLLGFRHLAVRDDATKRLIEKLTPNKDVIKIPDPTFALEINESHANKYFLKKGISSSEKLICIHFTRDFKWAKDFCDLARINGYKTVSLRPCYFSDYVFNDMAPFEHAGIFKYFKAVITHRFHDTVFSLKNLTPVITALPDIKYSNMQGESKYSSILKEFDLFDNNYINEPNNLKAQYIFDKVIYAMNNFEKDKIEDILKMKKDLFLNYLNSTKVNNL